MQTFLPYASFRDSARILDSKRLGKQRVETFQVLQVLLQERLITWDDVVDENGRVKRVARPRETWEREPVTTKGWRNHPAVLMWRGHELALLEYQRAMCEEWVARGYSDACLEKSEFLLEPHRDKLSKAFPSFIGNEALHESHRSNLVRKEPAFYAKIWSTVPDDLPYVWPVAKV